IVLGGRRSVKRIGAAQLLAAQRLGLVPDFQAASRAGRGIATRLTLLDTAVLSAYNTVQIE
ncbi:MAG: hypothetical protein DWI68_02810, partial [Chloroflexi bacterium]